MPPGPWLGAFLSGIDVESLTGHDRVLVLRAHQRQACHHQAQVYRSMAAVSDATSEEVVGSFDGDDRSPMFDAAAAEIRAALTLTRRAAETELGFASDLRDRLPLIWQLLSEGLIDVRRAKTIANAVSHLPEETAREVVDQISDQVSTLTTGQLGAHLRRLCIETNPDEAQERYEHAASDRRLMVEPTEAGTANLHVFDLAPDKAAMAANRINQIAKTLKTKNETRTIDQIRADVLE